MNLGVILEVGSEELGVMALSEVDDAVGLHHLLLARFLLGQRNKEDIDLSFINNQSNIVISDKMVQRDGDDSFGAAELEESLWLFGVLLPEKCVFFSLSI